MTAPTEVFDKRRRRISYPEKPSSPFLLIIETKDELECHQDIGSTQGVHLGEGLLLADLCLSFVAHIHRVLLHQLGHNRHQRLCTQAKQQQTLSAVMGTVGGILHGVIRCH